MGWCGCDRSAGARAYLGARPGGRRRDGRWSMRGGRLRPLGLWWTAARGRESRKLREPAGRLGVIWESWGWRNRIGARSGDRLEGVGAEFARRVEAAPREFA